jgi:hypothetical protein
MLYLVILIYQIPDTRYQIPDTRYQVPDTRYPIKTPTLQGAIARLKVLGGQITSFKFTKNYIDIKIFTNLADNINERYLRKIEKELPFKGTPF